MAGSKIQQRSPLTGALELFFKPKEGDILVFPGFLSHQVLPNKNEDDRISVSFNFQVYDQWETEMENEYIKNRKSYE